MLQTEPISKEPNSNELPDLKKSSRDQTQSSSGRILAIDAYRGFTMLLLISGGLGLGSISKADPQWGWLPDQVSHREWVGCTLWDLIQPSFMFLVGVSMPFAFAIRAAKGDSFSRQLQHVFKRAAVLILVGICLDSLGKQMVQVQFIRVLQQIALSYILAFFFMSGGWRAMSLGVVGTLGVYAAALMVFGYFQGIDPWAQDKTLGNWIDQQLHAWTTSLGYPNLLVAPRGSYAVLNFLPSTATLLLGALSGEFLRVSPISGKSLVLLGAGLLLLGAGWSLGLVIPLVKRIWTPSFCLFAAGWTLVAMSFFHELIEDLGLRKWSWPFAFAGMNSILLYAGGEFLRPRVRDLVEPWIGPLVRLTPWGTTSTAMAIGVSVSVLVVFWGLAWWLHTKKIYFKA